MATESATNFASKVELTLFAADATRQDVGQLCAEARRRYVCGVCVNGSRVELACTLLDGSGIHVVALVGFPLGAMDADVKRYETETAVDHGAHEIDCVLNLGWLKDGQTRQVLRELRDIVEAADERPVKAILETHLLTQEETALACQLALDSGARFIGTSTGSNTPGVTAAEVASLRRLVGEKFDLKASGDLRDSAQATALIEAGATRLGLPVDSRLWPS
jgi:deoxyribose-phosphate aldolase